MAHNVTSLIQQRGELTWLGTDAGHLILMPRALRPQWSGIEPPRDGRVVETRFRWNQPTDAACDCAGTVALDGQNILIYRAATDDQLTVDFCVGVTARFAAVGVVLPLETPRGVAAMTTTRC